MKTLKICILILFCGTLFSACNDEWTDELYEKLVSFKAPISSSEDVRIVYARYSENGEVLYDLPVILSGSQESGEDMLIHIGVDNDTLNILNKERFQYRTDLYYKQLPEQFYELPSQTCVIPKGDHTANYQIKFKFENLDLVERWVLPLTIMENPSYKPNYRKGWSKALLHIRPFNDYSGGYSSTSMNIFFEGETTSTVTSTRIAWVVDENTVFFYAGMTEESSEERGDYKIFMRFEEASENPDGSKSGLLNVYSENPDIDLEIIGQPTYSIKSNPDEVQPFLVREYCTVNLKYRYNDVTSIPDRPIRYRAEGSMTMERIKNTLIPDEDQAIMW